MRRIPLDARHEAGRALLGARIAGLRAERGMTVRGLAAAAGTSPGYLSDVERGRSLPGLDVLERVAGALGLAVSEVLDPVFPWGTAGEPPGAREG